MSDELLLPKGRAFIDADGIVHLEYEDGIEVTLEDARASIEAMKAFVSAHGRALPMLIDVSGNRHITVEARRHFASPEAVVAYTALALIGGNPVANLIANVFLAARRGGGPARVFARVDEALEWLRKHRSPR